MPCLTAARAVQLSLVMYGCNAASGGWLRPNCFIHAAWPALSIPPLHHSPTHQLASMQAQFAATVKAAFDAEAQPLESAAAVNSWVDKATWGKITDIIDEGVARQASGEAVVADSRVCCSGARVWNAESAGTSKHGPAMWLCLYVPSHAHRPWSLSFLPCRQQSFW